MPKGSANDASVSTNGTNDRPSRTARLAALAPARRAEADAAIKAARSKVARQKEHLAAAEKALAQAIAARKEL